jgi:NAD(P)H-hydrate epimerase
MNKFITSSGLEVPAVTTDQMREIDRIAIEETGPNLFQMMENAGRCLAIITIGTLLEKWKKANIIIMAGTGGNGGGGICAARHLANRKANVKLCLSNPDRLSEVASLQRKTYLAAGGKVIDFENLSKEKPDFIIDALIGYSLKGTPRGRSLELIEWANNSKAEIFSLDVPSGFDSTTGLAHGKFVKAKGTVTLALPKTGLTNKNSGKLFLADLGIPEATFAKIGIFYADPFGENFFVPLKIIEIL